MHEHWIIEALASELDRHSKEGLSRQLTRLLRDWIVAGRLVGEVRLPASRDLAQSMRLGRNTVLYAYEQLLAEGYLIARQGAGTFVNRLFAPAAGPACVREPLLGLSMRGQRLCTGYLRPREELEGAFVPCVPELSAFPHRIWQQLQARHNRHADSRDFNYQTGGGLRALREVLSDYLQLSRSVRCHPDRILITQGAQQSLALVAHLLADAGDVAWMEEPGYLGAKAALAAAGLELVPAPVDADGLNPQGVTDPRVPRLIYTTPSHQFPSGVVMTLARRLELLERAERSNAWVIEDDYDSEFRYSSQPIPALQGLADSERVIYVGTMSKVMYPGLRIAYLVLPDALIDAFRRANARLYPEGHYRLQAALAEFIERGHFARHVRRMRELYRSRQACLRLALGRGAGECLQLSPGEAGMHLVATLPSGMDAVRLAAEASQRGVCLRTLGRHYLGEVGEEGWVLGYAGISEAEIRRGVEVIAAVMAP
ncbi:PLP-dependent aminotransferase family protein [Paludibacterium yongneupense]|uniref:MocR-like pyridoxine biosynthesis transcription factor PdxR n=1 Tax=Paludibacterium yongneupense TaxID=400061 RepID=UPI00048B9D8D|nr:PLP-dependent aminotransferase family protein [Paludibacterium yongneupense]